MKVYRGRRPPDNNYVKNLTPQERLGMMWDLALDSRAFKGEAVSESGLQRHSIGIVRGGC